MLSTTRAVLATVLLVLVPTGTQSGQQLPEPLRDISKVTVRIALASKELPSGITESRLRTITELKLRTAGLRVLSDEEDLKDADTNPTVRLSLIVIRVTRISGSELGYVFSTDLSAAEYRYIEARKDILRVELWQHSVLNTAPSDAAGSAIESAANRVLDEFLNNWLKANPQR